MVGGDVVRCGGVGVDGEGVVEGELEGVGVG